MILNSSDFLGVCMYTSQLVYPKDETVPKEDPPRTMMMMITTGIYPSISLRLESVTTWGALTTFTASMSTSTTSTSS